MGTFNLRVSNVMGLVLIFIETEMEWKSGRHGLPIAPSESHLYQNIRDKTKVMII